MIVVSGFEYFGVMAEVIQMEIQKIFLKPVNFIMSFMSTLNQ